MNNRLLFYAILIWFIQTITAVMGHLKKQQLTETINHLQL